MALSSGTRLGPYEILSAIGAGGMDEVYKARKRALEEVASIVRPYEKHPTCFGRSTKSSFPRVLPEIKEPGRPAVESAR